MRCNLEYQVNLDETVEEKYFLICILMFNVDNLAINNKDKNKWKQKESKLKKQIKNFI